MIYYTFHYFATVMLRAAVVNVAFQPHKPSKHLFDNCQGLYKEEIPGLQTDENDHDVLRNRISLSNKRAEALRLISFPLWKVVYFGMM